MSDLQWQDVPAGPVPGGHVGEASFGAPAEWSVLDPARLGVPAVVAAALEPERGGFRASAVLTATAQEDLTFADWQNRTDEELPALLDDYRLVDLQHVEVAGRPGGRRLAHHVAPGGTCAVLEQWSTVADGVGWSLTWTVDVLRYDAVHDLARASLDLLRIGGAR